MSLVLQSVSPHIGAEVIGADLSQPVGDNLFRELHQAWVDADGLLIVRDQRLTPEQQIAFSRQFGELASAGDNPVIQKYTLPGYPEIFRVSNKKQDGEPLGREDAGTYWHSDGTWQTHPSKASILYALEVPRVGGNNEPCRSPKAGSPASRPSKLGITPPHPGDVPDTPPGVVWAQRQRRSVLEEMQALSSSLSVCALSC